MSSFRRRSVRRVLTFVIAAVAIVVVVLLALIAEGILVLPSNSPAPVTISSVQLQIDQGVTVNGDPWLGPSIINYTSAEGYPIQVAPGGTWSVAWTFINFDNVPLTISQVSPHPSPPFSNPTTVPSLPYTVAAGDDDGALSIIVTAPSDPGATYSVILVVTVGPIS